MAKKPTAPLSALENRFLQVICDLGSASAEQIRLAVAPDHVLKDSTVRTVLRRLEEKGYATHAVEGRTFVYGPTSAPQAMAADAVRKVIAQFCQGSVEQLLVGMVDGAVVSPQKLAELAQRIAAKKTDQTAASRSPKKPSRKGR